MRTCSSRRAGFLIVLSLPAWAGCVRVPPGRINADRMDFGQVIQESWKRQTLTRSLLQPVAPAALFQLMQGGLSPELVMTTLVRSINGLRNDSFGVAGDPGFRELVGALARIQRAGALGNRVEARKDGSALILIFRRESAGPGPLEDLRRARELLGLREETEEIEVIYGLAPRTSSEVAVITRTMLGIITELAMDVEVPADHLKKGWSFTVPLQAGDTTAAPHVRIRSGAAAPEHAYAAVPYEGFWYWIDSADIPSKRTFTFLLILFSLAETGQAAGVPVVTVPSR